MTILALVKLIAFYGGLAWGVAKAIGKAFDAGRRHELKRMRERRAKRRRTQLLPLAEEV